MSNSKANPPDAAEERYRLYLDECGDHVFRRLDEPSHRYLCLLGCWFRGRDYRCFHTALEEFKHRHIPHNPDEPVILHREDIINRRRCFWRLCDREACEAFDRDLLQLIGDARFTMCAVVIDKKEHCQRHDSPAHPYHLAIGFLLQRYCGLLNHINRSGDIMAESRGGREDSLLKDSFRRVYDQGAWMTRKEFFQRALTSKELKVKPKAGNIAGLQLADLFAHPIRQAILIERGRIPGPLAPFAERITAVAETKLNRHLYDKRVWGYGKVWYPR